MKEPNFIEAVFKSIISMSGEKREKLQISWAGIASVMLALNLLGTFDVRRYVDVLKNLPEIQRVQREQGEALDKQGKSIKEIEAVLKRNGLAAADADRIEISTAQYDK